MIREYVSLDVLDRFEEEFDIQWVKYHDNYNVGPYLNNDIALIQIK